MSGAKAYNVLFDTDLKLGATGANADPNYVPATNSGNGNPGFEREVALETGSTGRVAVYNVDGIVNPTASATYSLTTHHLVSVALSRESGDADYFYDFFVPAAALGLSAGTPFRIVVTTNTNPGSAFQGTRSDIYGINDALFPNTTDAWQYVGTNLPSFTLNDVSSSGSGTGNPCTAAPTVNSGIAAGTNVTVSGTWNKLMGSTVTSATITVYKNGVSQGTTTCTSGGAWSLIVPSIAVGDIITAAAQGAGESMCMLSNSVVAKTCSPSIISNASSLVITCLTSRGIGGTKPDGARVKVYTISPGGNPVLFADDATTSLKVTYNGTNNPVGTTVWEYQHTSDGGTSNPCGGGSNDLPANSYVFTVTESGKCESGWVFPVVTGSTINCIAGSGQTAAPVITSPTSIYPSTTVISGTAAANSSVRLLVNNFIVATTTATSGGAYTFNYPGGFQTGDVVSVRAQSTSQCVSPAASLTVTCYTSPPIITTDLQGNLTAGATTVTGTSGEPAGTIIRVYLSPSTQIGTTTVQSNGTWTATVSPALANGASYYATAQNGSCAVSANSASATARTATTICPTITGTYTESAGAVTGTLSSPFSGTVYLYQDGALIGSTNVTSATAWTINISAANPLYAGGILTVGAQASGGTLNLNCSSTTTVTCNLPGTPVVSPTSTTINVGETVTYTLTGTQSEILYSITDAANEAVNYAPSNFGSGSSQLFTTSAFNTPGVYQLKVSAISLSGAGCVSEANMTVTVNGVLPLTWLGFTLRAVSGKVYLEWLTTHERNVRDFVVEHSLDGVRWTALGVVNARHNASGREQYEFLHAAPAQGINYYRILQRDEDGRFSYSAVRKINTSTTASPLVVFPNPVTGDRIQIRMDKAAQVEIYDEQGRRMLSKQLNAGIQTIDIQSFSKGIYLLRTAETEVRFVRL